MDEFIGLCDQQNCRIVICNADDLSSPVWEWASDDPAFINVSGLKMRRHKEFGTVVLVCASRGFAGMISYDSKEILWQTRAEGNLHSIELLPNGNIAIAASDGNFVRVYDSPDSYKEIRFSAAHGVLYDEERDSLWALGEHSLIELNYKTLEPVGNEYNFKGLQRYGHDLAPYYGDTNLLWITIFDAITLYDKKENCFKDSDPRLKHISHAHTKGIGNTPYTNRIFYIYPNGKAFPWCTDEIHIYDENGAHTLTSDTDAYYKLRIMCENYQ